MENKLYILLFLLLIMLGVQSCKKDEDPNIQSITFEREYFQYTPTTVTVSGVYAYDGRIDGIKMQVGQRNDLADAHAFNADIDGTNYTVEVTGLQPGTEYHYCYEVDYGFSKPYKTETKTFAMPADSPLVKTLEVMALDSTTVRVKCEVVAEGGQEVTERGICWNTFGDPTLDDETMQHASGGVGQYSVRMEDLALGKKYYVRAYAKNAVGIGLGEEMEFETPAPPGMPVSIVLSCDPEEGGSVSGGGTYPVGSQCTVTAVANAGYTFVNWTENGSQVSTDATYIFNVTRECNLVANFTTQAYVITAEVTPDNSGTVTGAGGYNHGEECTLTAVAKPGYEFVKWTKNGATVSTNSILVFTVTASETYVALFQTKSYIVNVSALPSNGGTVTGGGTYTYGQSCTVNTIAAEGYAFLRWTDNGEEVSTDISYTFTVTGNRNLVANFASNVPMGALNGLFSVSANKKVYFSQGNLQFQASTNTWRFAENQWDYVGEGNSDLSQTYSGWIDLFGWGTSGYNHGAVCYQPWGTSRTSSDYYAYGQSVYNLFDNSGKADWGYNVIDMGGNVANIWRTLTKDEWVYMFNTRNTHSGIRYAKACVNGINGIILLPDNWDENTFSLNDANQSNANYSANWINGALWNTLQEAGAVFLPAAGYRLLTAVNHMGNTGYYWSASCCNNNNAYFIYFNNTYLDSCRDSYRHCGRSVRLVQDYNP